MYETLLYLDKITNAFAANHPIIMAVICLLFLVAVVSVLSETMAKNKERRKMYR